MFHLAPSLRRRRLSLAIGTSTLAWALACPADANAQCAPEPTQTDGTTTCAGIDADGLRVTTGGTKVVVGSGATVQGAGGVAAITLAMPIVPYFAPVTINVAGRVDGGAQAAVSVVPPAFYYQSYPALTLTVASGGTVTGVNGLVIPQTALNQVNVAIDNAGTITGSSGIALLAAAADYNTLSGISSITNRAGGFIGAISGSVGRINNAGTIDGGSRSAIDPGGLVGASETLINSGTITAATSGATIANRNASRAVENSGLIANTGAGAAIAGTGMTITNKAGGRISTAGAVALSAGSLNLTNAGIIDGNVVVGSTPVGQYGSAFIDSSAGTINGDVLLGGTEDTLVAGWGAAGLVTGITGAVDGGGGVDTLRVVIAGDRTLSTGIAVPINFEQVTLAPASNVTVTLGDGFAAPAPLRLGGAGTIVNETTLSSAGQLMSYELGVGTPTFINKGALISGVTPAGTYGITLWSVARFENSGSITAAGDGVSYSAGSAFVNSGTITAAGTALSFFGSDFSNSGTIRSTGGTGAVMSGSFGSNWVNTGRIEGAAAGARLSSTLTNRGLITSPGTAVVLDFYGVLDNKAGGVVTGGTRAIAHAYPNSSSGAIVANAGTINGDVLLQTPAFTYPNANRFFALPGGVLNGNLTLGWGDTLIAELPEGGVGSGAGAFAGITGMVSGAGAALRYRVRSDASATIALAAPFTSVGYELYDGANLTLTSAGAVQQLSFAGKGSVDVTADVTVGGSPAIITTSLMLAPGETSFANALAITSRGAITLDHTDGAAYPWTAVAVGTGDSFTNAGTVTVADRAATIYSPISAISGGKQVTNSGTILLGAATGIQSATEIVNSGSIAQIAGTRPATGITSFTKLTNSGSIDVAGIAVNAGYGAAISNSGRIGSTGAAAISANYATVDITNLAGGVITGGSAAPLAIAVGGGTLSNAGTINGSVDLGYTGYSFRSQTGATYVADGGTISGDLRFGDGYDIFIDTGAGTGVSGAIDGGAGQDTFVQARKTSGTVTLGAVPLTNFELLGVQAIGSDTVLTVRADPPFDATLYVSGNGAIVNTATLNKDVQVLYPTGFPPSPAQVLASFTNQGTLLDGFVGPTRAFSNSGSIATTGGTAVMIDAIGPTRFDNTGSIVGSMAYDAVSISAYAGGSIASTNSGTITNSFSANISGYVWPIEPGPAASISLANSGDITSAGYEAAAVWLGGGSYDGTDVSVTLNNSGTIDASGQSAVGALLTAYGVDTGLGLGVATVSVINSGTIRANGGGVEETYFAFPSGPPWVSVEVPYTNPAIALAATANPGATVTVRNTATGTIEATGARSTAILGRDAALDLTNDGTIRGGAGAALAADDLLIGDLGRPYLAGAIQTMGDGNDRIVNNGTIIGSIDLGLGDDRIENYGQIEGDVFLGLGDDTFLQRASATLIGTVDAGDGIDSFIVDATGGGTVNGDQFVNFERFSQIGDGNVTYAGNFRIDTIGVSGGSLSVAAGQTLSSDGATTITGSGSSETVTNYGTVAGSADLGGGNDVFVNGGSVLGSVALGGGDDRFAEGAGSSVAGVVDGGAGNDIYAILLSGDRSGIRGRTGFERLAVEGSGTLALTLDQSFDSVSLGGAGLNLQLAGFTIGAVSGSDTAESLTIDGDIANIALGGGNDLLVLGGDRSAGFYLGQGGTDQLRFAAAGPVTLTGTVTGFEQILLSGGALTVTGTLGAASDAIGFGEGDQRLAIANGGKLAGVVDLGAGNDSFRLISGGTLNGSISGGAGSDTAVLDVTGGFTLGGNALRDFEVLTTEGSGAFTIASAVGFERVSTAGNFTIAGTGVLTTGQLALGGGDDRMTIAGRFTGSVDGGSGTDLIAVSGGSLDAPIGFTNVANIESFAMSGGYATLSGSGVFGSMALTGGRFIGLAGSSIGATQINVGQGATFGSAGNVTGNLAVAGTLSPGASPGTMTVTGNVALAGTSLSVFELTPTVYDKLIVNGALSIAPGATLQLVTSGTLRPGASYDLITASGGITGSYSTVLKPDSLFGFIVQNSNSIRLLGQFLSGAGFTQQVRNSIDYANATLAVQPANSDLFAAVPALLLNGSASNPQAFAQLTPEPYAAATQMGVDNALTLTDVARGPAFATGREEAGFFTFGQTLAQWRRFGADAQTGSSATKGRNYGFLGGVGFGSKTAMVGAFAGYLNDRQQIGALGARNKTDGFVAGVHGRWTAPGGLGVAASILYDGADARTDRALPGAFSAAGRYGLHSWAGDLSVSYAVPVGGEWSVRPKLGLTYVETRREGGTETGGSPFALTVARDRHVAGFGDAALSFGRSDASQAPFRPFVSIGARYQLRGMRADAVAGYAGGRLGLTAFGPSRARLTGTAASGFAYSLDHGLDLFATASSQVGTDDHQETLSAGIRLQF
ncbi:autotransporter outer membrane beta-barrel domain-containing protein [Sphingomonas sp. DT-207]|uniref:autotransporter outer membrane beta-barrel domain-containing protein n=1 Tax=Sphingomonas sp. DT-207 TaxID=3396167 RepID=UPI003F1DCB7C